MLQDGLISLEIAPEVSALDPSSSYRSANISIPGFIVRRAQTSVDLKSGQSFMIAGLLQSQNDTATQRIPGLGRVPVLGALFSSKAYQRRETDLVIIVTPYLVKPMDPTKKPLTPLDTDAIRPAPPTISSAMSRRPSRGTTAALAFAGTIGRAGTDVRTLPRSAEGMRHAQTECSLRLRGSAAAFAGCSETYQRIDGLTPGAGDAIAANTVMQMVDPWQYGVQDTDLSVPADRGSRRQPKAVDRSERRQPASARRRPAVDGFRAMAANAKSRKIMLVSTDKAFAQDTRAAFAASDVIQLVTVEKNVTELRGEIQEADCGAVIIDMDAARLEEIEALQRITRRLEGKAPIVVVTQEFNAAAVRILVQLKVADFLVKPLTTADLVRSCIRALQGPGREENTESQIYTFIPAAGGVGTTTLALQTAFQLHNSVTRGASTCVVDLNFQQGACAEYLDLEPRFDIAEIENQPERLDRQLLDVMLSKHASGLCVLAAPTRPSEMRSFNTDLVVRVLDLVSAYFDNVVIDMPRTWFPWTETVLLGSNKLYIVSEMTVPCLRHTQRLIQAIYETAGKEVKPNVIVNRFEQRAFENGIKQADVEEILGDHFAGGISNNYRLVRQAVDRGVPLQEIDPDANVINDLKKIILPEEVHRHRAEVALAVLARQGPAEEGVVNSRFSTLQKRTDAPAKPAEQPRAGNHGVSIPNARKTAAAPAAGNRVLRRRPATACSTRASASTACCSTRSTWSRWSACPRTRCAGRSMISFRKRRARSAWRSTSPSSTRWSTTSSTRWSASARSSRCSRTPRSTTS